MTLHCQVYSDVIEESFPISLSSTETSTKLMIKNLGVAPQRLLRISSTIQATLSNTEKGLYTSSIVPKTVLKANEEYTFFVQVEDLDDIITMNSSGLIVEYINEY